MPITELPGSDHLDGTLFLCTGLLTVDRLGCIREAEGQDLGEFWDFKGFFNYKAEETSEGEIVLVIRPDRGLILYSQISVCVLPLYIQP